MMKRIALLLIVVALSLGAQAYTTIAGFYGETWLDHVDEDGFGGGNFGNGTQGNPYQIRSAGQLAFLARAVNRGSTFENTYFVIAADIDLDYAPNGSKLVWVPIGCSTKPEQDEGADCRVFKGTLTNGTNPATGKPYEIRGMTIRAYSTETTTCFGLFGVLRGTVDGLVVRGANIFVDQTTDEYHAGIVCGHLGKGFPATVSSRQGTIRNCTVEQAVIEAASGNDDTCIGGLVGCATLDITELSHNLAKSTMRLSGPMLAGGVAGMTGWETIDCHAVIDMTVGNGSDEDCFVGGVVGYSLNAPTGNTINNKVKCCTSSGEIRGDGSVVTMGGVIGYADNLLEMGGCTTCIALSGGHTIGGLIGHAYSAGGGDYMVVDQCYSSSYVDGSRATYAGGLFGYVEFGPSAGDRNITPTDNLRFSTFAGTMKQPVSATAKYGSIVGYETDYDASTSLAFGQFRRDYRQCGLQTNGMGWADNGAELAVATYFTPRPVDGDFRYDDNAMIANRYMQSYYGTDLFYQDNMRLAGIPFNVTSDGKAFFDLWDTTVDFRIGTFKNRSTAEPVATFAVPTPPACVEVVDDIVRVLDPGEADVIVNYNGLQRKVHLTLTYGLPWDGTSTPQINYTDYFAGGDGTAANPYVIHNVKELCRVLFNRQELYSEVGMSLPDEYLYNVEGKHYILANDLFINTHLLGEDEQPKADAQPWYTYPWHATLHGNGKTIYGLYLDRSDLAEGASYGLFTTMDGTVTDLAVVDSYVRLGSTATDVSGGLLCGKLNGGTVERCMTHGVVQVDGYAGGLCGQAASGSGSISDCFASVHVGWVGHSSLFHGAGITYTAPETMRRCVSVGKVENSNTVYGLTQTAAACTDCWFDRQMISADNTSTGSTYTKDMVSGQIMTNASAWQNGENRYPMLKQFAQTSYGDLLSMAVRFADGDRAGRVTEIFEFPTENVRWRARSGAAYLDVVNECGAAAPNGQTGGETEHLLAEPLSVKSQCTKALRALAVNVHADKAGIAFEDDHAAAAARTAFDANGDGLVTLREAYAAVPAQFATFNTAAADVETFPEFRFFGGVTTLSSGMVSGLSKLRALTLPQALTTIGTNAFNGCTSLEEIELPYLFGTLHEGAFYGSGIRDILVDEKNPLCRSIDGALYLDNTLYPGKVDLMAYPPGRGEEDATLSVSLKTILPYAIYKVPHLKNLYIDNCLPEGEMAVLEENGIVHEEAGDLIHVYVNDGSFHSQLFQDYYNDASWGEYDDAGCLGIYYPLNITSALWGTLYIDFPTQLPEGLTAYVADVPDESEGIVVLHSIGRLIPPSTPVAIKAEAAGLYHLYKYNGTLPIVNKYDNQFVGSYIGQDDQWGVPVYQEDAAEGNLLTLGRSGGVVGFYKYNGAVIPPYRAYLTRSNLIGVSHIRFGASFEDELDGIADTPGTATVTSSAWHALDGRRLTEQPSRQGIYIVNGKKIVIK